MMTTTTSDLPVLELDRAGWRAWLSANHGTSRGCWLAVDRRRDPIGNLPYLDAVEEALCFGWIDSTVRRSDGMNLQRFSPRRTGSNWTELNLERCRRLERLGLMTDAGRAVVPKREFAIDGEVMDALRAVPEAWVNFQGLPELYTRVRIGNIQAKRGTDLYWSRLERFVEDTRRGILRGNWNDGGRLLRAGRDRFARNRRMSFAGSPLFASRMAVQSGRSSTSMWSSTSAMLSENTVWSAASWV